MNDQKKIDMLCMSLNAKIIEAEELNRKMKRELKNIKEFVDDVRSIALV